MTKSSGFKMKGSPMQRNFGISPMKHEPWFAAHKTKVSHDNTAEAHGKKSEDYYDGSKGKVIQSTGATRSTFGDHSYSKKKEKE